MSIKKIASLPDSGSVVGTIHSPGALKAALRLPHGAVDYLELRVDSFINESGEGGEVLKKAVAKLPAPLIVTVRDPREGAVNALPWAKRQRLYREYLGAAALIDVELRNAARADRLMAEAQEAGVGVILSHHDFKAMPSLERLITLKRRAQEAGGDVFKVAATTKTPLSLAILIQLMAERQSKEIALAAMGMGVFGKTSRLVLGRMGSVLNYGFLDKLQVSGQWPAAELKRLLGELSL